LRKLVIARDPLCQLNFEGCTRLSTLADHKTPKNAGGDDSMDNLQGVCSPCHGIKTRTIDPQLVAAYRNGRPGSQKTGEGIGGSFSPEDDARRPLGTAERTPAK
jgi:hypothetical protein